MPHNNLQSNHLYQWVLHPHPIYHILPLLCIRVLIQSIQYNWHKLNKTHTLPTRSYNNNNNFQCSLGRQLATGLHAQHVTHSFTYTMQYTTVSMWQRSHAHTINSSKVIQNPPHHPSNNTHSLTLTHISREPVSLTHASLGADKCSAFPFQSHYLARSNRKQSLGQFTITTEHQQQKT